MSAQSVTVIYRAILDAAAAQGLLSMIDPAECEAWRAGFTAHSTRIGLIQDLFASGEDLAGTTQEMRWNRSAKPALRRH